MGHQGWVSSVKWSDEYTFVSSSYDGTVKIWDTRSSLALHTLNKADEDAKLLAMDAKNGVVFTGGEDKKVVVFKY